MSSYRLLVHSAEQVVQVVRNGEQKVTGKSALNNLAVINKSQTAGGVSIVVDKFGKIADIGYDHELRPKYKSASFEKTIDAAGMCIIPGLVDAHTHPVWAGDRVHEFALKLAGASYLDVHKAGGGINFSVEKTREASEENLLKSLITRLQRMLQSGTTLVEAKSGYGLNSSTEMKLLKIIEKAKRLTPVHISSTFCGAHAVPKGMDSESATVDIIEQQLPQLRALMASGEVSVDSIDVFCEKGIYDLGQSERILQAGRQMGLLLNFHADELHPMAAAEMGARLGAEAMSHLEEISETGIKDMAKSGSVAVLLPTTAYVLRLKSPPARKFIESGVAVALGSDFNPNAFCMSMPLVMNLACVTMKMSMEESLMAATINAAAALKKSHCCGSLEVGKLADMVILNAPRWEHLVYQMAGENHVIKIVVKEGTVAFENIN